MDWTWRGKGYLCHSQAQYQKQLDRERYRNKYASNSTGKTDGSQSRGAYIRREQKAKNTLEEQKKRIKEKAAEAEKKMKERGRKIRLNQKLAREWDAKMQRATAQERMGRAAAGYGTAKRGHIVTTNLHAKTERMTANQAYTEIMNKIAAANYIGQCAVLGLAGGSQFDKACDDLTNYICNQCDEYMANYGLSYDDAVAVAQRLINDCGESIALMITSMRAEQQQQIINSAPTYDPATGMW